MPSGEIVLIKLSEIKIAKSLTRVALIVYQKEKSSFRLSYLFSKSAMNYFAHEYFKAIIVKFEEKTSK